MENQIIDYISAKNPLHSKKVKHNLERIDGLKSDLGEFLKIYQPFLKANKIEYSDLVDAYLLMVGQITCARISFMKTGHYPAANHESVIEEVYGTTDVMQKYMLGLALSQFLWSNHYALFTFYKNEVAKLASAKNCLEIGSGHGLFLLQLLKLRNDVSRVNVVDISETSLQLSKSLIKIVSPRDSEKVEFINSDIARFSTGKKFDFITMGEVLEHVPDPKNILESLRSLLAVNGRVYMSTCINCPTMDHIYLFRNVGEIHQLLDSAGFAVETEILAPAEDLPADKIEQHKLDISYGVILKAK